MASQKNRNNVLRVLIDVTLSIILILEMFYSFTGNTLHEVLGVGFFATLVIHILLTQKWIIGAVKAGRKNFPRLLVMGAIFGCSAVLLVSSIMISELLDGLGVAPHLGSITYDTWSAIHFLSAYALCGFAVVHLALHWASAFRRLSIPYNPARRKAIGSVAMGMASLGALALGLTCTGAFREKFITEEESAAQRAVTNGAVSPTKPSRPGASGKGGSVGGGASGGGTGGAGSGGTGNSGGAGSGGGGTTTSICTLCKKRCSLSAPKCNRPYEAGLI